MHGRFTRSINEYRKGMLFSHCVVVQYGRSCCRIRIRKRELQGKLCPLNWCTHEPQLVKAKDLQLKICSHTHSLTHARKHARTHPPTHTRVSYFLTENLEQQGNLMIIRKSRLAYSAKKQTTQTRALKSTGKFLQVKGKRK